MPQLAAQAVHVKQLFDLSGRVAFITGGSIGLGRQMAEALAEMGANVALCARKKERCQQAAEELKQLGVKTLRRKRSGQYSASGGCDSGAARTDRCIDQ